MVVSLERKPRAKRTVSSIVSKSVGADGRTFWPRIGTLVMDGGGKGTIYLNHLPGIQYFVFPTEGAATGKPPVDEDINFDD